MPLWEILADDTSVKTLAGRASKAVTRFAHMIQGWQEKVETTSASELVQEVIEDSGYIRALKDKGTDEDLDRIQNVQELYNAVIQFEEENEDATLLTFLASAALNTDLEDDRQDNSVSLMTLHSSKGLEFPVVFVVGLEQGLFPSFRSLDDAAAIEEERRLCYVGITRAQERLFLTYARERRLYGNMREIATPSMFLGELPEEQILANTATALPRLQVTPQREARLRNPEPQVHKPGTHEDDWGVGEKVVHNAFGEGTITHIFGAGNKICLAIKFPGLGKKIIDPRVATLTRVET